MAIRITEFAWFDQVGDLLIINGYLLFYSTTHNTFSGRSQIWIIR
jgi:hypothetical protein